MTVVPYKMHMRTVEGYQASRQELSGEISEGSVLWRG